MQFSIFSIEALVFAGRPGKFGVEGGYRLWATCGGPGVAFSRTNPVLCLRTTLWGKNYFSFILQMGTPAHERVADRHRAVWGGSPWRLRTQKKWQQVGPQALVEASLVRSSKQKTTKQWGGGVTVAQGRTDAFENGRRVSLKTRMPSQVLDINKLLTALPGAPGSFTTIASFALQARHPIFLLLA